MRHGPRLTIAVLNLLLATLPAAAFNPCMMDRIETSSVSSSYFGQHLAVGGDLAVVGLPDEHIHGGAAVVYRRSGFDWVEEAVLRPDGLEDNDQFGWSVDTDGQFIVAGAPETDNGTEADQGAVYVFQRSGGQWIEVGKLTVPYVEGYARFGISVSLDGDRVIAGADYYSVGESVAGAAFVYRRDGRSWTQEAMLTDATPALWENFGWSVSLDGDRALVGAYEAYFSEGPVTAHGTVTVFRRNGTAWTEEGLLYADDSNNDQQFGYSVDLDGDQAIVGARWDDEIGSRAGAAFTFAFIENTWTQTQKLLPAGHTEDDYLGTAVAIQGDNALVGAPRFGEYPDYHMGIAYLYHRDGTLWSEVAAFIPDDATKGNSFGYHLAMDGSLAIIGSPWSEDNGAAYLYGLDGSACGPTLLVSPGPGPQNPNQVRGFSSFGVPNGVTDFDAYDSLEGYGTRLAVGDINGDGLGEIVTGPGPGPAHPPLVRAFTADGTRLAYAEFSAYGVQKFGTNVSCGDIDGDGFDEIITGPGPGAVFGPHVRGWNIDGVGSDPLAGVSFFAYGTQKYGVNVACGDIDGDGFDEIVTGAGPGAVFGPHVRGWNVDGGTAAAISGISYFAYGTLKYGVNVACADVDGDGIDEIVTGSGPGAVFGPHIRGWNYDGSAIAAMPGISFFAYGTLKWGARVCGADLDGDGDDELLTTPGPGAVFPAHVRGFDYDGSTTGPIPSVSFFAFEDTFRYGADLAVGELSE
jgi:hypothetical protein